MSIEGRLFSGNAVDLWGSMPVEVLIIDDVIPTISVAWPISSNVYNKSNMAAQGTYTELGSGLRLMQYVLNGAGPVDFYSFNNGKWTLPLIGLLDGSYNLTVWAIDGVGNIADTILVEFLIDTVKPLLEISQLPELVNRTPLNISGLTEPDTRLQINDKEHTIGSDGTFNVELLLNEGSNTFFIEVIDRANNSNTMSYKVILDTVPPLIQVTNPIDFTWVRSRSAYVEGMTEPGVDLHIDGERVEEHSGEFRKEVMLKEGEVDIIVIAVDAAGNSAMINVTLYVDWTAPRLNIISPETPIAYTRDKNIQIYGTVDDVEIALLTINSQIVSVLDGQFLASQSLIEGRNEFQLLAIDAAGNTNSALLVVIMDTTPPDYTVELVPIGGSLLESGAEVYSTTSTLELNITAIEEAIVWIEGHDVGPALNITTRVVLKGGSNTISFRIRDRIGNEGQDYMTRVILDTVLPEAIIVTERTIDIGITITLDGSSSSDNIGISNWTWSIKKEDAETILYGETVEYTFDEDGSYLITLTVRDMAGNEAIDNVEVTTREESVRGGSMAIAIVLASIGVACCIALVIWLKRR
jgi:hypothetical protein